MPADPAQGRARITGVILAGGEGRRLGGADKGLQALAGRPLVAHVIERLAPQVDELLISANRNAARYAALGRVIADAPEHHPTAPGNEPYLGPLAGMYAGLAAATTPLVQFAPCDTPGLPLDFVARLRAALEAAGADAAVAASNGREHPVVALLRREPRVLDCLSSFIAGGGRRVTQWLAGLKTVRVDFPDAAEAFANLNTPEDFTAWEKARN